LRIEATFAQNFKRNKDMKKLLMASAVALFGLMSAQEYKPVAGDVTVDLGISGGWEILQLAFLTKDLVQVPCLKHGIS